MSSRGMMLLLLVAALGAVPAHGLAQSVAPGWQRTLVFALVMAAVMYGAGLLGERMGLIKGSPRSKSGDKASASADAAQLSQDAHHDASGSINPSSTRGEVR